MFKRKAMMDQIIIDKKTYEKNTQWIREMRKYPDHETFAVGDLVLVYHSYRIQFLKQSLLENLIENWCRTIKNTNCPRQNTLFCVLTGVEC